MRIGEIERIGERELPGFTTPVPEPVAPEPKREKVLEPEKEPEKVGIARRQKGIPYVQYLRQAFNPYVEAN